MRKIIAFLVLAVAAPAFAQEGRALEDQPPVRHRKELRDQRFAIGPMVGFTFLEPYKHTVVGGLKVDYHLFDWLAVGGMGVFGVTALDTGLTNEIADAEAAQIAANCGTDEACARQFEIRDEDGVPWEDAQNSLQYAAAVRATVIPLSGKLALFSKLFAAADLYVFGGLGVLGFKNDAGDADLGNDGLSFGGHVGGGFHLFFSDWLAFNFEVADTLAANNPSGRNTNESSDPEDLVNEDDKRFGNNLMMLFGATIYFPSEAARSK